MIEEIIDGINEGVAQSKSSRKNARRAMSHSRNFVCLVLLNDGSVELHTDTANLNPNDMRHDMLLKTEKFVDQAGEIMIKVLKKHFKDDLPSQQAPESKEPVEG